MLRKIGLLTAAALLAGGIGGASAQTSTSPGANMSNQCWDTATNQVRDRMATQDAQTKQGSTTVGSSGAAGTQSGSGMAGGNAVGGSNTRGTATATRPAGMANC